MQLATLARVSRLNSDRLHGTLYDAFRPTTKPPTIHTEWKRTRRLESNIPCLHPGRTALLVAVLLCGRKLMTTSYSRYRPKCPRATG